VVLGLAFAAFAAGLLELRHTLGTRPDGLLTTGIVLAFLGAVAGASMQALFRARQVLDQAFQTEALAVLRDHRGITLTTLAPGILFPAGLLVLSLVLFRRIGALPAAALGLGAVLFPLGHAAGVAAALLAGDAILLVAFVLAARSRQIAAA